MKLRLKNSGAIKIISTVTLIMLTLSSFSQTKKEDTSLQQILKREYACSKTLILRSQQIKPEQEQEICKDLSLIENKFHTIFDTKNIAVSHDNNHSLRANIYSNKEAYTQYAGTHFNIPTNNGGMYLEGLPHLVNNQAEFIAYQNQDGSVKNLAHEYVHYLDGRFNLYGDFCANLHDSHAPPENCPQPAPLAPYLVWWTEGIAEYIARGNTHPNGIKVGKTKAYLLSQLFDTAYEKNNGPDRVYAWGYLATRFMMENHRNKINQMLVFTRHGDYPRYQSLIRSWGTSMDSEFTQWLEDLN